MIVIVINLSMIIISLFVEEERELKIRIVRYIEFFIFICKIFGWI